MTPDDVIKEIRVLPGVEDAIIIFSSGFSVRVDRHGATLPGEPRTLSPQHIDFVRACLDDACARPQQ